MEMIWHENEFVQEISIIAMCQKVPEEQPRPRFILKKRSPFPRIGRDKVGLRVIRCMLACGFQKHPSGAKAPIIVVVLRHG